MAGRASLSRAARRHSATRCRFARPAPPQLPGYIPIETAVPCAEPFDDRDWLFSVDWDGARALLFLDPGGSVRIQGETVADLARRFPDVSRYAAIKGGRGAVLDGVIAVLDREGRPDLAGFGRRLAAGPAAAAELPAVYLCFRRPPPGRPVHARLVPGSPARRAQRADRTERCRSGAGPRARSRGGARRGGHGRGSWRCSPGGRMRRTGQGVASPDRLRIALSNQTTCVIAGIVAQAPGRHPADPRRACRRTAHVRRSRRRTARPGRRRLAGAAGGRPSGRQPGARRRAAVQSHLAPARPSPRRSGITVGAPAARSFDPRSSRSATTSIRAGACSDRQSPGPSTFMPGRDSRRRCSCRFRSETRRAAPVRR